jgi:micrococcal nuclease
MVSRWSGRAVVVLGVLGLLTAPACSAGPSRADQSARRTTAAPPTTTTTTTTIAVAGALPEGVDAVVVSITDGDTVRVRTADGSEEPVRLIGIDTPETRDPRRPVECFGREASAQTAALLPAGTPVRLERDVELRDRYDRLLAYVWRAGDGVHVNEALVAAGWAAPFRVPPNVKYADRFTQLGALAREQGLGLWGACGDTDTPDATQLAPSAGDVCDTNYAGACVPRSTVDLDCADVGGGDFQVVGADPHGFDGDHDGVACE